MLSINLNLTTQLAPKDDEVELIDTEDDLWIKHLNTLWVILYEQREPPTDDKLIQINLGDEANPKPIFISETLSLSENEDLITLVREYIYVFARSYEDMPELDPKVATH